MNFLLEGYKALNEKGQAYMNSTAVALWKQAEHVVSTWRDFENRSVTPPKTTDIKRLKEFSPHPKQELLGLTLYPECT